MPRVMYCSYRSRAATSVTPHSMDSMQDGIVDEDFLGLHMYRCTCTYVRTYVCELLCSTHTYDTHVMVTSRFHLYEAAKPT